MSKFDSAKCYQIDGYDRYDTVEDCLIVWAEGLADDCLGPVTVDAFRLADRVPVHLDELSDNMLADFEVAYMEANLGLTDDIDRIKDPAAYKRCKSAIWAALADFEHTLPITRLVRFASRTYDATEVLEVLRAHRAARFREMG